MSQTDSPGFVQACAIRVARLAADGTTPAGATNGYITKNLVSLKRKSELEAGKDFTVQDACGALPITYRDRDIMKRYGVDIEFVMPDPELSELLVGAALITGTIGTTRTVADGTITTGSTTLTSPTIAFTAADVGNVVTATGIPTSPSATTIVSIASATAATMSAAATATTTGTLSMTLTAGTRSIGAEAPVLGVAPIDYGVSVELWQRAVIGGVQAAVNPWIHWAFPRLLLVPAEADFMNDRTHAKFTGFMTDNPGWGNGPWNDWRMASPSTASLTKAWGWFRSNDLPTTAIGYSTVPAQV